ncbi:hypothetical protein [Nocardia niwae]|nr:hypothetical protein [Nocardia niwae]
MRNSLAERHLRDTSPALLAAAERLCAEQPPPRETIRQLIEP